MKPLDPRLLRYAVAARWFLVACVLTGVIRVLCVLGFSWLVSEAIVAAFLTHATWQQIVPLGAGALGLMLLRAATAYASELFAARAAASAKQQLRSALVAKMARLGPAWAAGQSSGELAIVAGRGLDALDGYFARYLPQLVLTAIATPVLVAVLLWQDWLSGVTVLVTLPLIPLFMALIGWFTQRVQADEWQATRSLAGHFVDVVAGLGTLKVFGRQHHQREVVRRVTREYGRRTMRVLRVSFLSGFVLELASTLAVALVAVEIGTRLIAGSLDLQTGLFVLLIVPEAFLPLRMVGSAYHAATEGIAASSDAFAILDTPDGLSPRDGSADRMSGFGEATACLTFVDVAVSHGDRALPPVSFSAKAGALTVIAGPSGAGKSSLFAAALGQASATGRILAGGTSADLARGTSIACCVAWCPQRPMLAAGTIEWNVRLADQSGWVEPAPLAVVRRALDLAAANELDEGMVVGADGEGLSGGQQQRVALARAYYRRLAQRVPVLLLDEPTSALDSRTEARVIDGWRALASDGAAVVVVSHRPAVIAAADSLVRVGLKSTARERSTQA